MLQAALCWAENQNPHVQIERQVNAGQHALGRTYVSGVRKLQPAVVTVACDCCISQVLAQPSADIIAARKIKATQLPSYDCKVDIWAVGVLMYEALMGVTPFNDADPQAACLKAQFRAPLPLLSVSAACADFVLQALAKQAAKRPSAAQLLAHPWVQAHMTSQEVQVYMEQASAQRWASWHTRVAGNLPAGKVHSTCPVIGRTA